MRYLERIASILRYHHAYLNLINETQRTQITEEAFILQVADHVAVLSDTPENILDKAVEIIEEVQTQSGIMFDPKVVDAFRKVAERESFWLDIDHLSLDALFRTRIELDQIHIHEEELTGLVNLFRRIIDFRSRFTSTHTSGVGAVAAEMLRLHGGDVKKISKIRIAGYLHDIGKLTVPTEILEKPGFLSHAETNIIRGHTYFTNEFLSSMQIFQEISEWASQHHERLNGRGYPFHMEGNTLSIEARILAIADVFTAMTEDRPYRKAVSGQEAMLVLDVSVQKGDLDPVLVKLLGTHLEEINQIRIEAQLESKSEYERFISALNEPGF